MAFYFGYIYLKHVKENDLVHGEFGKWLESVDMNDSYARKFMTVYEELGDNRSTLNTLGMSALYQIATLPEPEREKERCYIAFILSLLISIRKAI